MLIGIDFDNTIVGYDHVFVAQARARGLVDEAFVGGKADIRTALRGLPDGERKWMELQGRVYGTHMADAEAMPGVFDFFRRCRHRRIPTVIVSHKTRYGHFDPDRVDLREAARCWLVAHGLIGDSALGAREVYFEGTRADKVARIAALGCTHFIDDLEEVFVEPGFPRGVRRILFTGQRKDIPQGPFQVFRDWAEISEHVLA